MSVPGLEKQRCMVPTLVTCRIRLVECANPFDERLHTSLLEDAHQGGSQSLTSVRWDLGNGGLSTRTLLHIASGNLLEFKVSCNVGGHEDVRQFAAGHKELGNEVNVPVVDPSVLLPWLLPFVVVSVLLEELQDVSMNGIPALYEDTYSFDVD